MDLETLSHTGYLSKREPLKQAQHNRGGEETNCVYAHAEGLQLREMWGGREAYGV